mmetsp:Transcript_91949/g.137688  ORF Transcript_91949/g.137688 Transcript_91949/m.137688 type:complete len:270 (+) Transcript_91949:119-928(+)
MEDVVETLERFLRRQSHVTVDLDAEWNPHEVRAVPILPFPNESFIEAAHVVLSPFGRPNGWHIKFPNRSMVHALLTEAETTQIYIGWKLVRISEYHYRPPYQQNGKKKAGITRNYKEKPKDHAHPPHRSMHNDFIVDDSMIRIENCPSEIKAEYIRYMMSRYDMATEGTTVIRWKGFTPNGDRAPSMYIVRFASAAWARAAVRELQSSEINGKQITLVQYPKQKRCDNAERIQAQIRGWWRPRKPTGNKAFYKEQDAKRGKGAVDKSRR